MIKIKCEYNILRHSLYHFSECKAEKPFPKLHGLLKIS